MRAALVTVGAELLTGDVVDTNTAWLGGALTGIGVEVVATLSVGDDVPRLVAALRVALGWADLVVVSGGLGPTHDDVTRDALAALTGGVLTRDEHLADRLRAAYPREAANAPAQLLAQADLPPGAEVLDNPAGSAPGLRLAVDGRLVVAVPGVPHEMRAVVTGAVLPDLERRNEGARVTVELRTVDLPEPEVAARLDPLVRRTAADGRTTIAYLAGEGQVRVRVTASGPDRPTAASTAREVLQEAAQRLGDAVAAFDGETLAGAVLRTLGAGGATLAVAESLTGGLVGELLTAVPGASAVFRGGVTAYATDVKVTLLGVPPELLAAHGAVHPEVAVAMARGARERLTATYGAATTGVAGPEPQDGRAVGTVHVAVALPDGSARVRSLVLGGDRDRVRTAAAVAVLDLVRRCANVATAG